ncbi:hypothetical protein ANRL4_01549 [Anaerolineae bacterium]|nr:hypothetical protein ANRL4_01549 [Anaerolineae bacterium]
MDVFDFRNHLIDDYAAYINSFIQIEDARISEYVQQSLRAGVLWPEPLIQLNPAFEPGDWIEDLVQEGVLHPECSQIFRKDKDKPEYHGVGRPLRLHTHQSQAIRTAQTGMNYVLTTGTGSGKSLAYIVPIVNHVLRRGSGRGIQAIVVYPMNALANSQQRELIKFLQEGYAEGQSPVTFARYTGQESDETRQQIIANPPDIILTNYVMLELILTRPVERRLIEAAQGLRFLVLDELHTYRGRQGADVALLVRRVRDALAASELQCVGTSATLAGVGDYDEQPAEVARAATTLFGAPVGPESVIGETLRRATPTRDFTDPTFRAALQDRLADLDRGLSRQYQDFVNDPLAIWLESTFGVTTEPNSGRLIRSQPRSISGGEGAAQALNELTGSPIEQCVRAIQTGLLAGYDCEPDPNTGFSPFAFKLHQFISRGDMVYASLESEDTRHITMHGQQYVPGDRSTVLLPLVFCRECGQEYYCVKSVEDPNTSTSWFTPRDIGDQANDENGEPGFLYFSAAHSWPEEASAMLERVPDDWVEDFQSGRRVRNDRKKYLPRAVRIGSDGRTNDLGLDGHYFSAPFRFCLKCGVTYGSRQNNDFAKLASLASEGRSTATTILSLSAIRSLRQDQSLIPEARKLLSFTDNRQDASLQAGHFNDFVEVGLLRSAMLTAVQSVEPAGLQHDQLTQKVFDALNLPIESYATEPAVRFQALAETQKALRNVLGYRLYRDLKRGWRITSPNLEQCGLLEIHYLSLDEVCKAEDVWAKRHPALVTATPESRLKVAKVLLDFMRRELAIKVDYLDPRYQENIQQQSSQRLIEPWAIDENETMDYAAILFPRPRGEYRSNVYLSARGGFGQYLRRASTFSEFKDGLRLADVDTIIADLLEALRVGGLVEVVAPPRDPDDVPGYQLPASALVWQAGDGTRPFHDPIRVPHESTTGGRTNPFFVDFYRHIGSGLRGLEAREHTAQVPNESRQDREKRFGIAQLPILYCSPTMELGVDIKELNVVNLRNVPPTPANYAQRSGRAGRSGQPALVFAYCSTGSPHDQYFFKRPQQMVAGAVTPPRLDLTNEDLIRAHVQAIWLAETQQSLGTSLKDILDVSGPNPSLALLGSVRASIEAEAPKRRAKAHAEKVLATFQIDLTISDWYDGGWLDRVLDQIVQRFDRVCERWRSLYRAALSQATAQDRIIRDMSRSAEDKNQAARLRREAEEQLKLLSDVENIVQSDFYSYRYFASEGFLPGYNFPRLPLSAYIPGRRIKQQDEFLSRPRFLAISEFGPRAIVYHEGSRYLINRVILPVEGDEPLTHQLKRCTVCGYVHPIFDEAGPDRCERCGTELEAPLRQLFRLRNVSTKRRDKINSDEEERMRMGYDIITGVRFADQGERTAYHTAVLEKEGAPLVRLTYGSAATLWRINLGWSRRANREQHGFALDVERGYWGKNDQLPDEPEADPMSARVMRVIPYVEDARNCLLFEPVQSLPSEVMASLQAALKSAIQVQYQLEDNELAAEPLPSADDRRLLLFYESAEGGAGVLRRLVDDATALARVAEEALRICHFDPSTGKDQRHAPHSRENCEAACYDCLMSYYNQREHRLLDRQKIRDILLEFAQAQIITSPVPKTRGEHLQALARQAGSDLERQWLQYLEQQKYRLPSQAQVFIEACQTRPDFLYETEQVAVYIDGPHHAYAERHARDVRQTEDMIDHGYTVIRFGVADDWDAIISKYPNVFGRTV